MEYFCPESNFWRFGRILVSEFELKFKEPSFPDSTLRTFNVSSPFVQTILIRRSIYASIVLLTDLMEIFNQPFLSRLHLLLILSTEYLQFQNEILSLSDHKIKPIKTTFQKIIYIAKKRQVLQLIAQDKIINMCQVYKSKVIYRDNYLDLQNIVMEKEACQQETRTKNILQSFQESPKEKACLNYLGGISLYNQNYQRHIENKNTNLNSINFHQGYKDISQTNSLTNQTDFIDQFSQEYHITSFMNQSKQYKSKKGHCIADQIQEAISHLKSVHFTTNSLLQQIQKQGHDQFHSIQNFQDLIEFYNKNNKQSFSLLLVRIFKQLKSKMNQQIQNIKKDIHKQIKTEKNIKDQQTQTFSRNYEREIRELQKQIKKKDVEYNVLYDYKKNKLDKKDTFISNIYLQEKIDQIEKLQEENHNKSLEIKKLRKQVDNLQDKFFSKIMENRKKTSLLLRQELQSIIEDEFYKDEHRNMKVKKGKNIISRKNKGGSHLLSRLSLGSNGIANKFIDLIASAFQINAPPNSSRQFPYTVNDFDSQISLDCRRSSKKTVDKKSLKNFIEKYQVKDQVKKSSLRKQRQEINIRNNSVRVIPSYNEHKKDNVNISKQSLKLNLGENETLKLSGFVSQKKIKESQKSSRPFKAKPKPSISKIVQNTSKQNIKEVLEEEESLNIPTSFKVVKNEIVPKKKLKKGVSFLLEELKAKAILDISSNQISLCYNPKSTPDDLASQKIKQGPNLVEIVNTATRDNSRQQRQNNSSTVQNKNESQKGKLLKSRPTQKKHFKVISCIADLTKKIDLQHFSEKEKNKQQNLFQRSTVKRIVNRENFSISSQKNKSFSVLKRNLQQQNIVRSFNKEIRTNSIQNCKEDKQIRELVLNIKSRDKFYVQLKKLHNYCAENCQHIKKYLEIFDKEKAKFARPTIKINYENINRHILSSNSRLVKATSRKQS